MESDLLKKEDEFYKENEKLELRTKELMKKVNDVMKIQDNLIQESLKTKTDIILAKQNQFKFTKPALEDNLEFGKNNSLLIPSSVDDMGIKNANQFYKAKLKTLQVEVVKLQADNRKKSDEIRKLQEENQKLLEDKDKWFMSYNSTKNTIGKLEIQASSLNSKFQAKANEVTALKKELDQNKKELKNSNLNSNNLDVRLARSQEENEKLKNALKIVKDEEKEARDVFKKQIDDLTATVKHIEKHKIELLNGFKKQLQLIDNLKKQKMYLETLKIADISETEYLKLLDWKWE
ncbi:unnamed protein product [Psylliodes chrysocephalus]|uniref:Uncharacterized protein n=1 Tax=Psylliodes chrysocephalus TaxID=3402493 RepID=A0A9P0D5Z0_9CUCU|nr:unnamed protein product [Psylliodes chrysocephala]